LTEAKKETPVVIAVDAPTVPVDAPTPVAKQAPSSSVVREVVADVERAVLSVEDAVRALVALVKDHRRAGDVDVENALEDVQAALAAKK
jgi:hypothetical protein